MVKINLDFKSNIFPAKGDNPLIIAGPCSAETEEQVLRISEELATDHRVGMLRAGIWKPRTRPNSFEGVGEEALQWLVNAGKKTGLPVTTEVANAAHVEQALKAGVDVLWIGARTTVNPFSVQEIADAIRGVNIPVMVKNPLNPDLMLWIGAMERISAAGTSEIGAIHRGFSPFQKTEYRNLPKWSIPIDLKRACPEIPLIVDPSHICGNRTGLEAVSQKALDLDYAGVMIETHDTPDEAWSDAAQQITPSTLRSMLDRLIVRKPSTENEKNQENLADLRKQIDEIDQSLIEDLGNRMKIAKDIGEVKKVLGMTILQVQRWDSLFESRIKKGEALGLTENFMKKFLQLVHEESIRKQTEVMNQSK